MRVVTITNLIGRPVPVGGYMSSPGKPLVVPEDRLPKLFPQMVKDGILGAKYDEPSEPSPAPTTAEEPVTVQEQKGEEEKPEKEASLDSSPPSEPKPEEEPKEEKPKKKKRKKKKKASAEEDKPEEK